MKIVINNCYGGFGISDEAYEQLIKWGIPVKKYISEKRGKDNLFKPEPENEGEIIFDRELTPFGENRLNDLYYEYKSMGSITQRYWDIWLRGNRTHPLLIKVVKKLGKKVNGRCADLKIIEIPNNVEFTIEEYDGIEHIAEKHKTWG